jgi:TonB-linked SusC/RagA family outer membrane protein
MNMRKLLYSVGVPMLLLLSFVGFAQDRVISGKVTDSTGKGIAGVSVSVKGQTSKGTTTKETGDYSLSVPANATTLIFSSVGYAFREAPISGGSVSVTMQTAAGNMNEIVVIGYGSVRKKDLTGSVATVAAKDFQKGAISTPEQLIAGKVAGVSIVSYGGQPGSGSQIRIRGGSSLIASNDPLIVIDGVPLDGSGIAGGNNPLSFINSNDIESFTVLKDASAAAIYGTRAANGVIIITTRKGRSGKLRVNFSTVNSVSKITDQVDVLTGDEVRAIVKAKGTADRVAQLGTENTNWQDQIFQTALATNNNISLTGGIGKLPFRVSLGYLNQEGVVKTDQMKRYSGAIVLSPVLFNDHLKIDINLKGSMQQYRFADWQGAIGSAIFFDPTKPVYANSKRFNGYYEWLDPDATASTYKTPWNRAGRNPLAILEDKENTSDSKRSIGNIVFDYKFHFLPELRANLNLGYDVSKGTGSTFVSDSSSLNYVDTGYFKEYKQTKQNTLLEFYLNYVKDLKSIHSRIDVMAGYSFNNYLTTDYNFATYTARGKKKVNSDPDYPFNKPEHTLLSYYGRLNYTYNDKYLLTATVRRDASSRFDPTNRWGTFPAVAFAWKLRDESFLRNSRVLSDLKLRLGWGVTGQQDGINNYDFVSYYRMSTISASYPIGNEFVRMFGPNGFQPRKWEETATTNLALDYGFLDNRITGSIDFYIKKTSELLNSIPAPAGTNFSAYILSNVGSMENRGVEFSINAIPIRNSRMNWDVSFNATYNKNEITNLTIVPNDPNYPGFPTVNISGVQGFAYMNSVGFSKNTFNLYHQIYDKSGKPVEGLFEDVNRDGILNEKDRYKGKRSDPNVFLGFSTNVEFGKWNAGFITRAAFNNYVYNNIYSNNGRLNQILNAYVIGNASRSYLETGFSGNTDQQLLSDYYIENASFFRMDNLNVGYNFGNVISKKIGLRANVSVQNVFVITNYSGLDPEVTNGVDNNIYPRPRIYSIGLSLDY